MPPLHPQDALSALHRGEAWRWVDVPIALADVAGQGWVVALVALALYAWLEREVSDVVEVFLPLAVGLAAAAGVALAARTLGAVPRPVGAGEARAGAALLWTLASGQAASVAAFAAYSLLAYGRKARPALLFALLYGAARVVAGPHWAADLAAGALVGGAVGGAAFLGGILLFPRGRLARLRTERRNRPAEASPAPLPLD